MAVATNRERVHTYLLVKGAGPAERIVVWDTQDVSVGRSPENDLAIDDAALAASRRVLPRRRRLPSDLATSNGTTVNGETIRTRVLRTRTWLSATSRSRSPGGEEPARQR
jgi:pSer/pThr/pTyr-binding forkhead associated (FHA) protein